LRLFEPGSACPAPDQLEQKSTVGCGDPAGAEGDVDLGLPDHMGDAEAVLHDRHTRTRSLPLARLVGREPERSGLEEPPQVPLSDVPAKRRQSVVELCLIGRVAIETDASVLPRREDAPRGRRRGIVAFRRRRLERREHQREHADEESDHHGDTPIHALERISGQHGRKYSPAIVEAVLAFAATLLSIRLSADLARRFRRQGRTELLAWSFALAAYALAAVALAWGAAAGWSEPAFRVFYFGGALLTAPLLGAGSLLLVGRRWAAPLALVYMGLALGVILAVPLEDSITGTDVPEAQDVLDLWPARVLAIVGNTLGTLAVVVVAMATIRRRPLGNALILAGVGVAALGSGLAGLGIGTLAPILALAALLLYAGFVVPTPRP